MPTQMRRYRFRLLTATIGINLLVLAASVAYISSAYQEHIERVQRSTSNLALVYSEYIRGELRAVDASLRLIKYQIEDQLRNKSFNPLTVESYINQIFKSSTGLYSLRMADEAGRVLYGIGVKKNLKVNITDRDYFITAQNKASEDLIVAKPVISRMTGQWVLNMALRLEKDKGHFAGVVFAQFEVDYLAAAFRRVNMGSDGAIHLRNDKLELLARSRDLPGVNRGLGEAIDNPELNNLLSSSPAQGFIKLKNKLDNSIRYTAYRRVPNYPLYVFAGIEQDDLSKQWLKELLTTLLLAVGFLLSTSLAAWLAYKRWLREKQSIDELRESHTLLETRVRERTAELENTLDKVKQLEGLLPICSYCKKIRDEKSQWHGIENYIAKHSEASFTHGICPECMEKFKKSR